MNTIYPILKSVHEIVCQLKKQEKINKEQTKKVIEETFFLIKISEQKPIVKTLKWKPVTKVAEARSIVEHSDNRVQVNSDFNFLKIQQY